MAVKTEIRECRIAAAVIRRAIKSGESSAAVGAKYGFTDDRVRSHAKLLGYAFPDRETPRAYPQRKVPPDPVMIAAFRAGGCNVDLAKDWNVSGVCVHKHRRRLVEAGMLEGIETPPKRPHAPRKVPTDEVIVATLETTPVKAAARQWKVSRTLVNRHRQRLIASGWIQLELPHIDTRMEMSR